MDSCTQAHTCMRAGVIHATWRDTDRTWDKIKKQQRWNQVRSQWENRFLCFNFPKRERKTTEILKSRNNARASEKKKVIFFLQSEEHLICRDLVQLREVVSCSDLQGNLPPNFPRNHKQLLFKLDHITVTWLRGPWSSSTLATPNCHHLIEPFLKKKKLILLRYLMFPLSYEAVEGENSANKNLRMRGMLL